MTFKKLILSTLLLFNPFLLGAANSEPCSEWTEGNPILQIKPYWETAKSEKIIACLKEGKSLKTRDSMGRTALHLAAQYNQNPKVIKLLIQAGANLEMGNEVLSVNQNSFHLNVL